MAVTKAPGGLPQVVEVDQLEPVSLVAEEWGASFQEREVPEPDQALEAGVVPGQETLGHQCQCLHLRY